VPLGKVREKNPYSLVVTPVLRDGMTIVTPMRVSLLEASLMTPLSVNFSCAISKKGRRKIKNVKRRLKGSRIANFF
jgi:hypothetical protein